MKEDARQNPDLNGDKVDKIKYHMENTIKNMDLAEEKINATDDEKIKRTLMDENKRREDALINMREEVIEEMINKK